MVQIMLSSWQLINKKGAAFECVAGYKTPPGSTLNILHQVKTPGHAQDGNCPGSRQNRNECAGLNRTGVDDVRFDLPGQVTKTTYQAGQIAPFKGFLATRPKNLVDIAGDGAVFGLPAATLQAYVKNVVFRFRQGGKKPVIVRCIVKREKNNFHQSAAAKVFRLVLLQREQLSTQICPAQFLAEG